MMGQTSSTVLAICSIFVFVFLLGCTGVPVNCVNDTCNGVTTCRDPGNIPPCAPIPPTNCPDGYVCGIQSDGCAVPGAIYNCPNEPVNSSDNISANRTETINLAQELNNSAGAGFSLNESMFYAVSPAECSRKLISPCDNNMPNQFICVNQQYSGSVSSQYSRIYPTRGMCPQFLMAGSISCGLDDNHCVVYYQGPN